MRMGEAKRQKMYDAIHRSVMELRVEIRMAVSRGEQISAEGLDELLYGLTDTIWSTQKNILGLKP